MQKFIVNITQEDFSLLSRQDLECFIINSQLSADFIANFAAKAKNKLVLTDSVELCRGLNLDGVVLDLSKSENIATDYQSATKGLKNKITGIITRNRRHEAMIASECEPDFLIFRVWNDGIEKIIELTDWYAEMFLIQSALLPMDSGIDGKKFKTDFVIVDAIKVK